MKFIFRFLAISALVLVALLLLIRVAGSPWLTAYANRKLAALPQYTGKVESIQIALWRGTMSATDLKLFARGKESDGPVVSLHHATLTIAWLPLFRGRLGGHGSIDGIEVMIVNEAGVDDPDKKEPPVREWQNVLRDALPLEITRFEIKNARFAFDDRSTHPAAEMVIDEFQLVATDFSNRAKSSEELPAHVTINGRVGGTGRLQADIHANPADPQPHFTATMAIKDLALVPIHDFLVKNALIDVSNGVFEVYVEVSASGGQYDGYIKPFFKNLEFKAVPDPSKNLMQRAAVKVASGVKDLLKNDQGQIATKAPFKGDFQTNKVDLWTTIQNLLRNAFVQSLREGLEGHSPSK